jgi:hypothetical protein
LAKLTSAEIERRWFDIWETWDESDRAAAIKVLQRLQERFKAKPEAPAQPTLPGVKP